ncbi:hypothetical protein [Arthrobacter sp. TWP1-1]|uniref:hypothetical protein n=1 Tax=Arthrobacter sp. TWP1-1 TaxID=2804568 RepID=UPI003CEA0875
MGNEFWINVLAVVIVATTAGILVVGCLLLRAMVGVRSWNFYLGAVGTAFLGVLWAYFRMYRLMGLSGESWERSNQLSDEMEVYLSLFLNGPLVCLATVFVGGLLLYLLGKTAARDRLAREV